MFMRLWNLLVPKDLKFFYAVCFIFMHSSIIYISRPHVSQDIQNRYLYARKERNYRLPLSRMRTCYEAFSLTHTIRMYLHFYVTYVIIALHYLTKSERKLF